MSEVAGIITALSVLLTAVGGFWAVIRQVKQVHAIVNSKNDALVDEQRRLNDRVEQLVILLGNEGIAVPLRPEGETDAT